VVSAPISTPKKSWRVFTAMMISSVEVFPARSPMPLMAPSICLAPAWIDDSELATASPRSLWQWVEMTMSPLPWRTLAYTLSSRATKSAGTA